MKSIEILLLLTVILFASCEPEFSPKPKGYFRIDFPKKEYQLFDSVYPYIFEYPAYAQVIPYHNNLNNNYWLNVNFTKQKATLHLSYFEVKNDLQKHLEDSRKLAYKHTIKAEAIDETEINFPETNVFGIAYEISGNAASTVQFFVTDSVKHFLRGALYFNVQPNSDSLAPTNDFITKDIKHFVSTLKWK